MLLPKVDGEEEAAEDNFMTFLFPSKPKELKQSSSHKKLITENLFE